MKKRIISSLFRIALLDRYIIQELSPNFLFSLAICSILSELIGISFEQVRFIVEQDLPIDIVLYVHCLKLPAFIYIALPFALLITTILVYTKLSHSNEIIALQTFGVSLYRLIIPALAIACLIAINMFIFHEFIVPPANYKAAMILEKEWNVDRANLAKYNKNKIIYQEFTKDKPKQQLKFLFLADRFDGNSMRGVTLFQYQEQKIRKIIIARSAQWNEKQQLWELFAGSLHILGEKGEYTTTKKFEQLSFELTRNILDYAQNYRDNREMNIIELYRRLAIVKYTDNLKKIRQLQISIQERYATPFSCLVFTWLGSVLGIRSRITLKQNSLGMAVIVIFSYYAIQFLSTALAIAGVISIFWGVWLPNLLGLSVGYSLLQSENSR